MYEPPFCLCQRQHNALNYDAVYHSVTNVLSSNLIFKNIKVEVYKNIILRVVLYGCETWSLTLREDCRLRLFENRVLRKIFGPTRDRISGESRRQRNK